MNTPFEGGLAAARAFVQALRDIAGDLATTSKTAGVPFMVGIVPANVMSESIGSEMIFHLPIGRGTPGNDTRPSNVVAWFGKGDGTGSVFINLAEAEAAFDKASGGQPGFDAVQSMIDGVVTVAA